MAAISEIEWRVHQSDEPFRSFGDNLRSATVFEHYGGISIQIEFTEIDDIEHMVNARKDNRGLALRLHLRDGDEVVSLTTKWHDLRSEDPGEEVGQIYHAQLRPTGNSHLGEFD